MTLKPILLLDIDGVLNAIAKNLATHAWPEDDWIVGEAEGGPNVWSIAASGSVCDFFRELHEKDLVEIRWHTTWQHQAENVAKALGLPTFPVQEAPEYRPGHWYSGTGKDMGSRDVWWKLPSVYRAATEGRPVIWVDDDIDSYVTGEQRARLLRHGATLLLCPDHKCGLVQKDLDKIKGFLESFEVVAEG